MKFRELDPERVRELLKEQVDVLTPLANKEGAFFRNSPCPQCQTFSHEEFLNPRNPFSPGAALPNKTLRCLACGTEFDPYTRLILNAGVVSELFTDGSA